MGRGVFAGRPYARGEVIEVCPVIPLTWAEAADCADTILDDYFFGWGPRGKGYALVLGFGELYNHSPDPNARYTPRTRALQLVFRARRPIQVGEQITIDYAWPKGKGMPESRI
jgi:SET domain-containing protein